MLRPHHEGAYATGPPPRCFAHMHRCIASVASIVASVQCQGTVPWEASNSLIREPSSLLPTKFLELLRNVPTNFSYSGHWTLNFLHSNEKFKSQRRGDESGAAVHLSNVTEYNNCFLGLMDAQGSCHLPGCDTWPVPPHRSACHHRNYGMPCQNRHQSSPLHRL